MRIGNQHQIPGPVGSRFFGSLSAFRADQLGFYEQCRDRFGGIVSFRLGPRQMVLVFDPEGIEQVLVSRNRDFQKHFMVRLLDPLLGNGLLSSEGDLWFNQRRMMQPLFTRPKIASYGRVFAAQTEREISGWKCGERRDIHADMQRLTMSIAAKTLLGVDVKGERYRVVDEAQRIVTEDFAWRLRQIVNIPMWIPTRRNRRLRSAIGRLEGVVSDIIRLKQSMGEPSDDVLSRLLAARDEDGTAMTEKQLRDEVLTLFLAGHETTANALTWTIYLLGQHPHIATRMQQEIDQVIGDHLSLREGLEKLEFTGRVLKESLRLLPPAYAFGREARCDTEISGFGIGKGTTVILSPWVVQRDAQYFDRPVEFDPDRWTSKFETQLPRYAYFPFGGGPRVCIGNTFALLEATLVLATIYRHFDLSLTSTEPVEPWPSITLRPRRPIHVQIRKRIDLRPDGDS